MAHSDCQTPVCCYKKCTLKISLNFFSLEINNKLLLHKTYSRIRHSGRCLSLYMLCVYIKVHFFLVQRLLIFRHIILVLKCFLHRYLGFPCSSVSKESVCSSGDPGLYPWVGKIPWRR